MADFIAKALLITFIVGLVLYAAGESGRGYTQQPDARFRTGWRNNNVPTGWEELRWLRNLGSLLMCLPVLVFVLWIAWKIVF